jgi:hypothetical protein
MKISSNIEFAKNNLSSMYYHVVNSNEVHSFEYIKEAVDDLIEAINQEEKLQTNFKCELIAPIELTFDIVFDSDTSSNNKGFSNDFEYCFNYVNIHNGTNHSYFKVYKGENVSIYCNEMEEIVYTTKVY